MKRTPAALVGAVCVLTWTAVDVGAGTTGALYDMRRMLGQTHPFAKPYVAPPPRPRTPVVRPAAAPPPPPAGPASRTMPPPPSPATPPRPSPLDEARQGWSGDVDDIFSEVRFGLLLHDQGPFSHNKEDGIDINLEVLFAPPRMLDIIWSPRPIIGLSVNSAGDTSQGYLGLNWEWEFWEDAFAGFSLGGAVHDGKTTTQRLDRKELGCRVLFRESVDVGYRFDGHHGIMAHMEHISNAKLCSTNEGLESFGLRYGYRF